MIELETPERKDSESTADKTGRRFRRATFRRRSAVQVLAISGFILLTVWGLRYAGEAGTVFRLAAEGGQSRPWGRVFDPWFIARACPHALTLLLTAIVGFFLFLRWNVLRPVERLFLHVLGQREAYGNRRPLRPWTWIALGMATVAAALAILEWIEPCYFVQDDNFANVLPAILQGCRSIFHGEFPDFDPCQLMGMPSAGKGAFTLLYPPTVVSYAIARWGLGNENYTLEVFAAVHLLAGYMASYAAARMAGLRPALAYVLGISFVLSGYILIVGRAWHAVLTLVLWLPLLFCCLELWLKGRANGRWLLATGLAIGGFYYTGFRSILVLWHVAPGVHRGRSGNLRACCRAAIDVADCRQSSWLRPAVADIDGSA